MVLNKQTKNKKWTEMLSMTVDKKYLFKEDNLFGEFKSTNTWLLLLYNNQKCPWPRRSPMVHDCCWCRKWSSAIRLSLSKSMPGLRVSAKKFSLPFFWFRCK